MKKLYAPWRGEYTASTVRVTDKKDCVFCDVFKEKKDSKNFILKRFKDNYIILNRYPYNAGHLLVIPTKHIANLSDLSESARSELMDLLAVSEKLLRNSLKAEGINIGLNQGKAAGAGIPKHLHFHVLPRWQGDTNFLPALAETKQISFDLNKIYKQLKAALDELI